VPSRPSRHALILLAALLVTVGTVRAWRTSRHSAGIDFYQYWVVGKVLARGDIPSVYDHDTRAAMGQEFLRHALAGPSPRQRAAANIRNVIEPMSTPFLFTVLTPFALGDYDAGFDTFRAASLGALLAGVFVLGRAVGLAARERVLVLAFIMFAFEPVAADLRVGNVGQLHLGMLALYVWLSAGRGTARQVVAGAVLGAATAFKPSLAAVGPLLLASWAFDRHWRRMAAQGSGLVAGGIGAVLVSAAVFGSLGAWSDWLTAVRTMPPMAIEVGNVSAVALAERSWGIRLGPLLTIVSALAVVSALGMRRRLAPPSPNRALPLDLTVVAAGCLVFLISSPLVWLHYLILALPAALLLLGAGPRRQWLSVAGLAAVAITPAGELLGVRDPIAGASIVLAGVVALFGLVLAEIAAPVPRESGSEPPDAAASRAV
jgi:hypothetical protein